LLLGFAFEFTDFTFNSHSLVTEQFASYPLDFAANLFHDTFYALAFVRHVRLLVLSIALRTFTCSFALLSSLVWFNRQKWALIK
jgi:hypothetical protein